MISPAHDDAAIPRCVLDARASLGECPVWSVAEQALWWVDINAPSLNRFDPATGVNRAEPMPSSIGCFAQRQDGGFVVALLRRVAAAPYDPAHHRFTDGRCDPQARLFVGTMNEKRDAATAALYRLDANVHLTEVFGGLTISNGLAWSPDGGTMYHADTTTQTIRAYAFDAASGRPSAPHVLKRFEAADDRPDGGAVDRDGCYWTALYRGGRIVRISPEGAVLAEIALPARCPTMCAFGGADLQTLYVTTARQHRGADELAQLPQSGGIFALRAPAPGLPEPMFAG
jgi:sugar lactone lactonase YvrE